MMNMLLGSIQMCGEDLSSVEVKDICDSLLSHNIRLLSARECSISEQDFKQLMKCLALCKSILQLNLNVDVIGDPKKISWLSAALERNRSLRALFVHGNDIGDQGMAMLGKSVASHPHIVSLDVGDCGLTDGSIPVLADLLPPNGAKRGLEQLTLSSNPGISTKGWIQFFVAMASSNMLHSLDLDYNSLGNTGVHCLTVALASSRFMESLDLEGTGITEKGGKMLLYLVENFPISLKKLVLDENKISEVTMAAIQASIHDANYSMKNMIHSSSRHKSKEDKRDYLSDPDEDMFVNRDDTTKDSEKDSGAVVENTDKYNRLRPRSLHRDVPNVKVRRTVASPSRH